MEPFKNQHLTFIHLLYKFTFVPCVTRVILLIKLNFNHNDRKKIPSLLLDQHHLHVKSNKYDVTYVLNRDI